MHVYNVLEKLTHKGNSRKVHKTLRRLSGFQDHNIWKNRNQGGNMVISSQSILGVWMKHFSNLLSGSKCATPRNVKRRKDKDRRPITRLKNNKAAEAQGLPAELFKHCGEE